MLYLQIGGAGGSLENYAPTRRWHMAKVRRCHHFCLVRVAGHQHSLQAFDDQWHLFDHYEITKPRRALNSSVFAELIRPPAPRIVPDPAVAIGEVAVEIHATPRDQERIYDALDGADPTASSPHYTGPFVVRGGLRCPHA